jgi:hypothetical protein
VRRDRAIHEVNMTSRVVASRRDDHAHGGALVLTGFVALAFAGSPAQARGPSCDDRSSSLAQACSDSNLEASIGALGVAYDVAESAFARDPQRLRELHYTQKLWLTQMHGCGTNTTCLATSILERQRRINTMRLGPARVAPTPLLEPTTHPMAEAQPVPTEPQPRSWWPTPPGVYATDVGREAPAAQPSIHPEVGNVMDGRRMVTSAMPPATSSSAWLAALVLLAAVPFGLHIAAQRPRRRRCPSCDGTRIAWEAVGTGRHLPSRRSTDPGHRHRTEIGRMRLACPCGYRSDAAMEARIQYELDFHQPTTIATRNDR